MNIKSKLWLAAAMAAMTALSHGQANWLTATSANWSDGTKWAGGVAPTSGTVYIDYTPFSLTGTPGAFTSTLNYNVTLAALFTKANFTVSGVNLSLSSAGSIVDGAFSMSGGSVNGGGMTLNGSTSLLGADKSFNGTQMIFNGPASQTNHIVYSVNSTLTFNNVFTVTDGRTRDGIMIIGPSGTLRKATGAGNYLIGEGWSGGPTYMNNAGIVESLSGTLYPYRGGTHSGTFRGVGGTVAFSGGTHNMLAGSKIESGVLFNGATISLPTASDTLQINGAPVWQSGAITSGGGALIGPGTLVLSETDGKGIAGNLTNQSNLSFVNGILYAVNSTFTNQGSFAFDGPRLYRDGIFNNQGVLTKTGTGQTLLGSGWSGGPTSFNNSGTVTVSGGSLATVTGGTHTGTFTGSGGTMDFSGATQVFEAGHVLNSGVNLNSGTFAVPAGGTLNCAGNVNFNGGILARQGGSGVANIGGAGSLNMPAISANLSGVLQNNGVFNINAGVLYTVNSTWTNTGSLNLSGAGTIRDGILNNSGNLTKSGVGEFQVSEQWSGGPRSFNNSGIVTVSGGALRFRADGTHSGLFHGSSGQLIWPTNTQTCNTGTEFRGKNTFTGATLSIPVGQQVAINGATMTAGSLSGAGTFIGTGPFLWNGTNAIAGTLTSNVPINMVANVSYWVNATLTNNSTITMNGSRIRDGVFRNNGMLKSVAGSNEVCESWSGGPRTIFNSGQFIADNSVINLQANGDHTGSFRTANGGTINFASGTHTLRNGSILGVGTATNTLIVCNESTLIEGESELRSNGWSGSGTIYGDLWRLTTATNKGVAGNLTCEADISHEAGVLYGTNATFTIGADSTTTVADGLVWRDGIWINRGLVQKVAGAGTTTLGQSWSGGPRSWTNEGTLHTESGALRVDTTLTNWNNASSTMSGGIFSSKNTGNLWLPLTNGVVTNIARFILDGASAQITRSNGTTPALNVLATNQGGIELYGGASLTPPAAFTNSGDVVVGVGSNLTPVGTYTQSGGHTKINGSINKLLTITGGRLSGMGTFAGANVTDSTVAPGDAVGSLTSTAGVTMGNCTFDAKVAGAGAGQFSKLLVTGTAAITNGTLQADAAPNSTVPSGTVVDVITATTRTGTFATIPPPADWSVSYGATFVRLTANRTITGPIQIEGSLELNGFVAGYATTSLTFVLEQGGNPMETQNINPFADRTYRVITRKRGSYDLAVRGSHWLTRRISGLSLTDAGISGLDIALINGDVDGDNEIGPGDFGGLSSAFGSADGDTNWNPNADLDGDGEVGPSDFGILSANFGLAGD